MSVLEWLQSLPELAMVAVTGLFMFGEAIIGIGLFVSGDAALTVVAATVDSVREFLLLWTVSTIATIVGSLVGFVLGRRLGPALRETKFIKKRGAKGWDRATNLFLKHGSSALFIGGMIPLIRSFVPAVAGAARLPYRAFLLPISAGAACLSTFHLLVGIGLVAGLQSTGGMIVIGSLLAVVATIVILKRRKRAKAAKTTADSESGDPSQDQDPELESAR